MDNALGKLFKILLALVAVVVLVGIGFASGFVSGNKLAATPIVERIMEDEPGQPAGTIERTEAPTLGSPTLEPAPESPATDTTQPTEETSEATPENEAEDTVTFDLYHQVWEIIERDFYGELPSQEEQIYGAIRGALDTLDDDYTSFVEPDVAAISRSDMSTGSFEGIGALVRMNEADQLQIVGLIEDQPAEAAGLRPGDIVVAVDGMSIEDLNLYEAIGLIRGPQGTRVVLTVLREGAAEPLDIEIERARIPLPTVEYEMLDGNIGYVRLYEFNGQATARLQAALQELLDQNPVGLIFDLRSNPGGYLNEAISVADEFLPPGVVLIERNNEFEKIFESTDEGLADQVPLVVLINAGSASASEIVAGAIQDRDRGVLIGEISFGKGSVQQVHRLSNDAELRVTIARWYTPNEQPIQGNGLEPDIAVPLTEEDMENDRDPQLERAIDYFLNGE
jgi:carboxyl-terminal processing protease